MIADKQAMKPTALDNFRAWYRHYRKGHVLVLGLGRWESFWRAVEWVLKTRGKN